MNSQLFPMPRHFSYTSEPLDLSQAEWICLPPSASTILKKAVLRFSKKLNPFFKSVPQVIAGTPATGQALLKMVVGESNLPSEGYRLSCQNETVLLEANDEPGLFYGLQTLEQLVILNGSILPHFKIEDFPDFPNRGIMLDVSRCRMPTMDTLFEHVDLLASMKINQFQMNVEHTFAFSAHETVWYDASPFTAEEILGLDTYCQERYIDLVPNLNSFGHVERWLKHPQYRNLAESPDGFTREEYGDTFSVGSTLKPNQDSLDFLTELYQEFLPNFSSRYFNAGCDETWELGEGWSKPLCEQKGKGQVYLEFLQKIHGLAQSHGRQMMFWGDIILRHPQLIPELPSNLIALNWGYEADHPFATETAKFAESGIPFYVCPGTSSWRSLIGRTENCLSNLASAAENGLKNQAIGFLNTDWGDGGHHQHLSSSYLGLIVGAAFSWSYESNQNANFADALSRWVLDDSSGNLGKVFVDAGKVCDEPGVYVHNESVLNKILFADPEEASEWANRGSVTSFRQTVDQLNLLENQLLSTQPQTARGKLAREELTQSLALSKHAAHRALYWLKAGKSADALRQELEHLIPHYGTLWLKRNRLGGLRESLGLLRNALVLD